MGTDHQEENRPMPRPRNQAARRQQLLEAALQVINANGPANVQMKDVADAAGLATGSVYYYYDNVDELLRHVHALAYERYYTSRVEAISGLTDPREKVATLIRLGLPSPQDVPLSLALYQVTVAKARDNDHGEMITDLCGQQVHLYQQILDEGTEQGHFTPVASTHRIAENIIALEDGYGLGLCSGNHDYDFDEAVASILESVSLWTQCPDLLTPTGKRSRVRRQTARVIAEASA
jgi:AcrR family transcriptional regulator